MSISIEIQGVNDVSSWLINSSDALYRTSKHAVYEASSAIYNTTLSNIASAPFVSDRLRLGVNHYYDVVNNAGVVDIYGNKKRYYNSYRLRFFEGGTKDRPSKHGKHYGHIEPSHFFKNAIMSNSSRAYNIIRDIIGKRIIELNGHG